MARRTLLSCTDQRPPGDSDSQVGGIVISSWYIVLLFLTDLIELVRNHCLMWHVFAFALFQVAIATSQSAPTRLLFEKPNTDRSILSEDKMTHGKTTQEPRACSHNSEHSRDKQLLKTTPDSSPSSLVSEVRPLHVAVAVPQATEVSSVLAAADHYDCDNHVCAVQSTWTLMIMLSNTTILS